MSQEKLVDDDYDPMHFYFREVQSGNLRKWTFEDERQIGNILEVIDGLERKTNSHTFEQLDLDPNTEMCITNLLDSYPDFNEDFCNLLINNFSRNLMTRAREPGKYAVLLVYEDSVVVGHTDSEEKTVTKDADVIERLLDTDNVSKYARFRSNDDGQDVLHFERHLSKSFSDWLGLKLAEVAYEEAGEIKIHTKIDGSLAQFEYKQEQFEEKFVVNKDYELVGEILRTPNDKYPVSHVEWGRRNYENPQKFLQDFYSSYFELSHYKSEYLSLTQSITPHVSRIIDHEDEVTKGGPHGETHVVKDNSEFKVVFADKNIELSKGWQLELAKAFQNDDVVQMHHVGLPLSEEATNIGPFEVYNELNINEERLNELYAITREAGRGKHLTGIISCVIFYIASRWSPSPISHFFETMAKSFEEDLDAEGMILRDEDRIVEFKDRDWVVDEDDKALAQKITKEIQSDAKLVLVGVEEEEQRIRPVARNKFDSERNERIRDALNEMNGHHESIELNSLPLGNGDCLLFVYAVRENQTFDLDMTLA